MKEALARIFTPRELDLLEGCKGFPEVFSNQDPGKAQKCLEVTLRFVALDLNDKMKEALSQTPQNKDMYPNFVADFNYTDNTLFQLLKRCVTSQRRSVAQKRKKNTDPLSKGTALSGKGAAGGAAKANSAMEGAAGGAAKANSAMEGAAGGAAKADPPMQVDTTAAAAASGIALGSQPPHNDEEAASGSKRRKGERFTLQNVRPDVRPLIEGIDTWEDGKVVFYKFLNENFGKPYGCEKLTDKAERVFLMDKLLRRMYTSGFFQDVKKFSDEGNTIKNFLRPGRTWKVRRDKIEEYNLAFRALQNLHFGRYESSKGFEHRGTTACMEMFRALGFTPPDKAKAHASPHYRGPSATDPTKVQDGQGNPKCGRDVLYIGEFEHNTRNVRTNLHYLWEDAPHQPKKFVNSNKRNVEVLLEAAQVVDSESSSERAPEPNSLGYSCKRACFGPK